MELSERAASNPDEVDEAVRSLKVAMAQQAARAEELAKLLAGTRPEEIAEAQAQLAEAEAALKLAMSGYRAEEIVEARAAVDAAQQRVSAIASSGASVPEVTPPGTRRLELALPDPARHLAELRRVPGVRDATLFGHTVHILAGESLTDERLLESLYSRASSSRARRCHCRFTS